MLRYDASNFPGYPDGQPLTDDIANLRILVVTMGKVTPTAAGRIAIF